MRTSLALPGYTLRGHQTCGVWLELLSLKPKNEWIFVSRVASTDNEQHGRSHQVAATTRRQSQEMVLPKHLIITQNPRRHHQTIIKILRHPSDARVLLHLHPFYHFIHIPYVLILYQLPISKFRYALRTNPRVPESKTKSRQLASVNGLQQPRTPQASILRKSVGSKPRL